MQTFLPFGSDFVKTAQCLDWKRLGKQRLEARDLWRGLRPNHPASKMWQGYENCLLLYTRIICGEWIRRGYYDTILETLPIAYPIIYPDWIDDPRLISSHRSNLLRKDYNWYKDYFLEEPNLPYWWPVS